MKKLDAIITKLSKVPSAIWILLVGASVMFANLYSLISNSGELIANLNDYMAEMAVEFTGFMDNLAWLFYIESAIIGIVIFELILMFVYRYLYTRRFAKGDMLHFKTAARVIYIVANIVVGLFSLISFAIPEIAVYGSYIFNIIVYTAAYLLIYLVLKESVINPKLAGTAFMKLFTLYFLLEGGITFIYFIISLTVEGYSIHEKIASGVSLAVIAGLAAIIYKFVAKPLLKAEKEYIEIIPPRDDGGVPPDNNNNEIFRGYGF